MKYVVMLLTLLGLLMTSCGATMRVQGTAPSQDNDGTCAVPVLYPMPASNPALKIHVQWTGPVSGQDSLSVVPGSAWVFQRNTAPGAYTVRVWASDLGGAGCDTSITVTVKGKPHKPSEVR